MKINSVPRGQFFCHAGIGRMAIARLNKNRDKKTVPLAHERKGARRASEAQQSEKTLTVTLSRITNAYTQSCWIANPAERGVGCSSGSSASSSGSSANSSSSRASSSGNGSGSFGSGSKSSSSQDNN